MKNILLLTYIVNIAKNGKKSHFFQNQNFQKDLKVFQDANYGIVLCIGDK